MKYNNVNNNDQNVKCKKTRKSCTHRLEMALVVRFFLQITKIRQLEQYVFGMQFVKMGGERSIVTVKDR